MLGSKADIAGRVGRILLEASSLRPTVRVQSDNIEILLDLCAKGEGVCFCPVRLAYVALSERQVENLRILCFSEKWANPTCFGYTQRACHSRLIAEFICIARESLDAVGTAV